MPTKPFKAEPASPDEAPATGGLSDLRNHDEPRGKTRPDSPGSPTGAVDQPQVRQAARIAILPLLLAIAIMLAVTIRPSLLTNASGRADHLAASLAFWSMTAGFVRGVGFVPFNQILRWLLSGSACALSLALAAWRILA